MKCIPEPSNRYDRNAVLVVAPPLSDVPQDLHETVTKDSFPPQTVKDVAGEKIGRVPKGICGVISQGIRGGWIIKAVAVYTGGFIHAGQVRGGGPQLKCQYLLILNPSKVNVCAVQRDLMEQVGVVVQM